VLRTLFHGDQYQGIANTIVQLIRGNTSGVMAPSQPIYSEERHQKNGLGRNTRLTSRDRKFCIHAADRDIGIIQHLRGTMAKTTSFQADIRPLFTERDIQGMIKGFNLASYDEVKAHAAAIYDRIRGIGGAVMPPPPPRGEGPWPQSRIELFAKWIADGCPP